MYNDFSSSKLHQQFPPYIHEVGCNWNFRGYMCDEHARHCIPADEEGVFGIHGNGLSFYTETYLKFRVIFEEWKKFKMVDSLHEMWLRMSTALETTD
ncbi:UNVERIFIED_CONTAM: hypothetical protein GTU68_030792, partial [Idotea baltica]|nr:hypothetical protein [Idotea baltica]